MSRYIAGGLAGTTVQNAGQRVALTGVIVYLSVCRCVEYCLHSSLQDPEKKTFSSGLLRSYIDATLYDHSFCS